MKADPENNIEVSMKVPCSIELPGTYPWVKSVRDILFGICLAIVLTAWSFSFQVSEDIIEECKTACDTDETFMVEVTSTRCTCMGKTNKLKQGAEDGR